MTRPPDAVSQADVIAFLSRPASYPARPARVDLITTHASIIFLAGRDAYKLKRAVRYPYLDYTTLARRRRYCEAEVALNGRIAPEIYRGALAVTREADGRLALGGDGTPVEWLVAMRRFDDTLLLDRLAAAGKLESADLARLGRDIARFHGQARRHRDIDLEREMAWILGINRQELGKHCPRWFAPEAVESFVRACEATLAQVRAPLRRRGPDGFVRDCHGDLHLRNICRIDGRDVMFDGIEFNDRLSRIDVLYDLAFLLMDLDHRGLRPLACAALNAYLHDAGDFAGLRLLPMFLAARSAIRAHTTATAGDPAMIDDARGYLESGLSYLHDRPARLLAIGGVSGSGKSTLAGAMAPSIGRAPGAIVLRTDRIRKQLFGLEDHDRLGPEGYSAEADTRVHEILFSRAAGVIAAGHSAVLDATFLDPANRRRAECLAADCGAAFAGVWLQAAPATLQGRVAARQGDASDADAAVLERQLGADPGAVSWARVASGRATEDVVRTVANLIDPARQSHHRCEPLTSPAARAASAGDASA